MYICQSSDSINKQGLYVFDLNIWEEEELRDNSQAKKLESSSACCAHLLSHVEAALHC